jgi:hypothetical protein
VAKSHPMTFFIISEQTPVGIGLFENAVLPKKNPQPQRPDNTSFITFGKNSPDMNCQPLKIVSSSENFPGKSGERLFMCGVPPGKWVKKYKNFGGLTSYALLKDTMRKFYIFLIFGFSITQQVCGQKIEYPIIEDSTIIEYADFYKNFGKIFPTDYKLTSINLPNYKKGLSLDENDILHIENVLNKQYPDSAKFNSNKRHWKKYWRQYLGYQSLTGEKMVFLHLEKFNRKTTDLTFEYWKNCATIVNEQWNQHNTDDFLIDLDSEKIYRYGNYKK